MNKLAIVFPGQGSQYIGMAKEFYDNYDYVREIFHQASEVLGYDLASTCFNGDSKYLEQTFVAQPALLTVEVAAYRVLMNEHKIKPSFLAGHSLGEISSLVCADAIEFIDAVKLVRKRGELMQEAVSNGKGGMIAITDMDSSMVHYFCKIVQDSKKYVGVSIYNSGNQTVVSGEQYGLIELEKIVKKNGGQVTWLQVSAPFHCELMEPAARELQKLLYTMDFKEPKIPVLSNVNALPYTSKYAIVENLTHQLTMPVQWNQTMYFLEAQDVNLIIDIGPKATLRNIIRRSFPKIETYAFDKKEDRETLEMYLKDKEMDKMLFLHRCMAIAVCTPNSNYNAEEYNNGVVKPYNNLKRIVEELESNGSIPMEEHIRQAINMLVSNFETKHTPLDEREERLQQLIEETDSDKTYIQMLLE
ncbi:[acyl-carrier-protein] S-malonyltransferase [Clostridium cavendishii DSM 21758]|uniref:[acyl-carrier-protein] S-malonyltransferase n=1 Tax=Clostridium cavendishii DSM 21758 TaxID=1121302 RepID=A0A1M6MT63_9CLOT|nr:ACP S-malonyltransferase [Clostridium cavendishii]SHJ86580.1 [acyl-carrier-protein] S-malonyltransferase [Clostridium cavendishii DSM 21758]